MQKETYLKTEVKARVTFYAIHGRRHICIQGPTMEAVLQHLRALCPSGNFHDLWQGLEQAGVMS